MKKSRVTAIVLLLAALLLVSAIHITVKAAEQSATATILSVSTEDGIPKGIEAKDWLAATGFAVTQSGNDGKDTVALHLNNLVPNGVYTLWWVNTTPSMSMGPVSGTPANEFKANTNGKATITTSVDSKNDYQTLVVAYHTDGKTHGEMPGKMGEETFSHLMGGFPGNGGKSSVAFSLLTTTDESGVPSTVKAEQWNSAKVLASVTKGMNGKDTVTVRTWGLVPNALYTLWWVNNMNDSAKMSMGPVGGTPANEVKTDKDGNALTTVKVASDNDYQILALAYHADGKTHGEMPGKMGQETFTHLMGDFPGAGGSTTMIVTPLMPSEESGVPSTTKADEWKNASGVASATMDMDGKDTVVIYTTGLVPNGVYTLWWVNNMMDAAKMSMGPVSGTPANELKADKNGNAIAAVRVTSDNDYQTLVLAYHADGKTHGEMPGKMGKETFSHLMGNFPGPIWLKMTK